MKKRGMSAVVTTLIIILLAIVAMGIIWVVVRNIINKGSDEITLTGLTLDLEITKAVADDNGTPDDETDDILNVTVKRNSGEGNLVGINFVIGDGDNSVVVTRDSTLAELGLETFTFSLSTLAVGEITSISVAPIFETSSGKEAIGEVIDTSTSDSGDFGTGDTSYTGTPGGDFGCTPTTDCATEGVECGQIYNGCEDIICGPCTEPDVCTAEGLCVPPKECTDTCETFGYECGTWEICDNPAEPCGSCLEGVCNETGQCYVATYLEAGTINNTYPPNTGLYFDADELTKTDALYVSYWAGFPTVDTEKCYQIVKYTYDGTVYSNAIVQLSLYGVSLGISVGDAYEIWPSGSEGNIDCVTSISS